MNRFPVVSLLALIALGPLNVSCNSSPPPDSARAVSLRTAATPPEAGAARPPEEEVFAADVRAEGPRAVVDLQISEPNIDPPPSTLGTVVYLLGQNAALAGDCTGFYVGENLFMTAAHCVENGEVDFLVSGQRHEAECREGPGDAEDWALCRFDSWSAKSWMSLASCPPAKGDEVLVLGYCDPEGLITAGVLNAADVQRGYLPLVPPAGESPNVCPGDSGGPAFRLLPGQQPPGAVVGVIAEVQDCTDDGVTEPCIAPTTTPEFRQFLSEGDEGLILPACQ